METMPDNVRVDGWLVQPSLNTITRGEVSIRLRSQLMDLLVFLASQPGKVVGKRDLIAGVWEGRWVAESAISRCIAELRAALGDEARRPHVIETITKRGYRLIAPVEQVTVAEPDPPSYTAGALQTAAVQESPEPKRSFWQSLARAATFLALSSAVGVRFRP